MAFVRLGEKQLRDNPEQQLNTFTRTRDFLVAIDTDGCVTDNMSGKQMLIFHPLYMEFYQLWEIETYAREVSEYYNLFSVHRGCNRFLAVQATIKALRARPDVARAVRETGVRLPAIEPLDAYIRYCSEQSIGLGNPSLTKFLATRPMDMEVYKLLGWSEAVNRMFPAIVIPPFDGVAAALELMAARADILVVSQTPYDDLCHFWEKNGLTQYIHLIAGQEMGTKAHHIEVIKRRGQYADDRVLMVGDADGDLKAVKKNSGLFYPVAPGFEQDAWNRLPETFERFTAGTYAGAREAELLAAFSKVLLPTPPWEAPGYDHAAEYRKKQEIRKSLYARLNPTGRLLTL